MNLTIPLWCLLGFVGWAAVLVLTIASWRGIEVLAGRGKLHTFKSGEPHGSDRYWRLNRAHLNLVENLPLVIAVTLIGALTQTSSSLYILMAEIALAARILQTLVHVAFNSPLSVTVRFTGFFAQILCWTVMAYEIIRQSH